MTGDEGTHLLGGFSYWTLNDYRLNPESGNFIQRWDALPVWLAGYDFPAFRDPAVAAIERIRSGDCNSCTTPATTPIAC